jgi:metallo-beta-lactamase family protein
MRVRFLGAAKSVTGSCTRLDRGNLSWLVDCGLFQGPRALEDRNWDLRGYRPEEISFVLLTHAHLDHSGLLPRLVRDGFRGKILATRATCDLCDVMLRDSGHIQEAEAEWENRKGKRAGKERVEPLYTVRDAEEALRCFHPVSYGETISPAEGVKVRFQDAGHILGSAIIELWVTEGGEERKLVFSGDLGSPGAPLVRDPAFIEEGDFLWLESTYGNRLHKSREETVRELLGILREAIASQGKVIIPAFAVERTQDILYTLAGFFREGLIPPLPVYIDSPLAISATEIFRRNADCFDDETRQLLREGNDPLALPGLVCTRTVEESRAINEDTRPGIIISASGMCDAGRIKHHLKHHLWRETSHVLFIGYQGEGTLGRRIIDGAKVVKILGEEIAVRARIHTLGGFSAHADRETLLGWLSHFRNPGLQIFVNHGEEGVAADLEKAIHERFPFRTEVPGWKEKRLLFGEPVVELPAPEPEQRPERKPISGKSLSILFREIERDYRRLRGKLKRETSARSAGVDPGLLEELDALRQRMERLTKEL